MGKGLSTPFAARAGPGVEVAGSGTEAGVNAARRRGGRKGASHQIWVVCPTRRWRWLGRLPPGTTTGGNALPFLGRHRFFLDAGMSDSHTASESAAADLTRLQQQLLRTRIDRARRMTEEQRLAEAFALTDSALVLIHEGVMAEMAAPDPALAWQEVRRRLERLRRARGVVPPGTGMPVVR